MTAIGPVAVCSVVGGEAHPEPEPLPQPEIAVPPARGGRRSSSQGAASLGGSRCWRIAAAPEPAEVAEASAQGQSASPKRYGVFEGKVRVIGPSSPPMTQPRCHPLTTTGVRVAPSEFLASHPEDYRSRGTTTPRLWGSDEYVIPGDRVPNW